MGTARLIAVIWCLVLGTGIVPGARVRGGSQPGAAARPSLALLAGIVFAVGGGDRALFLSPWQLVESIHPAFSRWGLRVQRPEL